MLNDFQPYAQNYPTTTNAQWSYVEANNYSDWESILQVFPQLKTVNTPLDLEAGQNVTGIVIRSANDDNVHKAIKYGIWTTTPKNRSKIQQLWQRKLNNNTDTFLFFSAVKSGMFEGVARLKSGYHEETFPFWWQNHTLKFKGYFQLQWIFIKDINNKHFSGFYNNQGEEVVKSKDCDTIDNQTTHKMLQIYNKKQSKRSIFMDFAFMDQRETQYVRRMYEATSYYNQYQYQYANNNFDLSQYSMVGHPLHLLNGSNSVNAVNPMMTIPTTLMRPNVGQIKQGNSLGFQMNPISKNKKK